MNLRNLKSTILDMASQWRESVHIVSNSCVYHSGTLPLGSELYSKNADIVQCFGDIDSSSFNAVKGNINVKAGIVRESNFSSTGDKISVLADVVSDTTFYTEKACVSISADYLKNIKISSRTGDVSIDVENPDDLDNIHIRTDGNLVIFGYTEDDIDKIIAKIEFLTVGGKIVKSLKPPAEVDLPLVLDPVALDAVRSSGLYSLIP